jgi:hypothetical protein
VSACRGLTAHQPDQPLTQQGAPCRSNARSVIPFADLAAMIREVRDDVDVGFAQVPDSGCFVGGAGIDVASKVTSDVP